MSEEKDTVQHLNRLRGEGLRGREPFEQDWWLNMAFYLGHHYVQWGKTKALEEVPTDPNSPNAPRPVANKIMHFAMQSHAAAMSHDPQPEVLAPTADAADRSAARVCQAWLNDLTSATKIDWSSVRSDGLMWAILPGTAWFKWFYNPQLKRPDVVALSPFEVVVDPHCKKAKYARWLIHSQFLSVEDVYDTYDTQVKPEGTERVDQIRANVLTSMGYAPSLSGVTVHELWERPSRRHPQGRYAVWTGGGKLLVAPTALPYNHLHLPQSSGLPFSQIGMVPVPGVPYYHSGTKFLRAPQMELNKVHSQILVAMRNFANPKWFIDSTMQLVALPTDAPNEVLIGDSQGGQLEPKLILGAAMADPGAAEWISKEMADIIGLHEVSQGGAPGRVDSARALELLRNEDLTRLAVLAKTVDSAIADGFWQLLMLTKQYVDGAVVARTYSRDGVPEVKQFMASSISADHIVRVISAAGMPRTQAARNEYVLSLWNAGILTDPRKVAELLDMPYSGSASDTEASVQQATSENIMLAAGVPVTANEWDDHETHVREHNEYRRTSEFMAATDDVRDKFEFHVTTHKDMELAEAGKEVAQQAQLQEIAAAAAPAVPVGDPAAAGVPPTAGEPGQEEAPPA